MSCSLAPLKCVLFIINVIFWIFGGFLLYAGLYYLHSNNGSLVVESIWPAIVIITSGSVLILGGIIGFIGTIMENKICLGVLTVFLVLILICEVCLVVVMFSNRMDAWKSFDSFVLTQFQNYYNATDDANFNETSFVDTVQKTLECCGYNNYTDWSNEAWHFNGSFVPLSCCKPENPSSNASNVTCTGSIMRPELIYTRGCKDQTNHTFLFVYDFISWAALSLSILLFIGILSVFALLCRQRNSSRGYSELSPSYTV